GLVLFYIGIRLSRYISGEFQSIFLGRTHLDIATKKSLEAIFRYLLIIIVVLFVLTIVGIPLTAFTVIGGAFAIGIGLGSQHLVNNFLSGLVLMIERPLKVGDIVEMENEGGVVEHIGGRSTRIKTFKNLRMVVPNSKLLENTVINWSLIDNYLRREINVGVIYGSPVKKVSSLIMKAVKEHEKVEKNPEPLVLFTDFGESALIFKVLFWIRIREFVNTLVIESDIRYRIDEFFREAGIIIAFPQQDVHFDSLKPIELKIISENKVSKQKTTNNTKSQEK
ncbi:MAG: mechanosensitive ion channel, partial [Candidatus Marinimicrobia bacterium]|nr:mechanosensitive ion channel [Candidatus Neomarinimicrobiota bacterium]